MAVPSGALRFNADSRKLEYYNGEAWWQIDSFAPDAATGGARGVWGGGFAPGGGNLAIDYVTISTTGNAISFGNALTTYGGGSCASSTRGLFIAGSPGINNIEYITISSTGNAVTFGYLTELRVTNVSSCSNSTRGIRAGGCLVPSFTGTSTIDYVTIASTGNAVSFGQLSITRGRLGACASSTRGIFFGGGYAPGPGVTNIIDYVTIASTGNPTYFGDLINAQEGAHSACSNSIRGIRAGGGPSNYRNVIEYITIASLGNSQNFGNISTARPVGACASSTRGIFGGGYTVPATYYNTIEYVTISTLGNATNFGQLTLQRHNMSALSNGHGGL